MQAIYSMLNFFLRAFYGLFAAFFLFQPGVTFTISGTVRNLLSNPCSIEQGMLGVVLSPGVASLIGILMIFSGVIMIFVYFIRVIPQMFTTVFTAANRVFQSIDRMIRIATFRGKGQAEDSSRTDDREAGFNLSTSTLTNGLAVLMVGALMTQAGTEVIATILSTLAVVFSGFFMILLAAAIFALSGIMAIGMGVAFQPVC